MAAAYRPKPLSPEAIIYAESYESGFFSKAAKWESWENAFERSFRYSDL